MLIKNSGKELYFQKSKSRRAKRAAESLEYLACHKGKILRKTLVNPRRRAKRAGEDLMFHLPKRKNLKIMIRILENYHRADLIEKEFGNDQGF